MRTLALAALLLSGCGFASRVLWRNVTSPEAVPAAAQLSEVRRDDARLAVLWSGHATVLVQLDDRFVLTDPVLVDTIGQISPRQVEPGLIPGAVPSLAAVVISHLHFDHLSFASLDLIEDKTPLLLIPPGGKASMPAYDFAVHELDRWQSRESQGVKITAVPVAHVGGRYGIDSAFTPRAFTGYVFEYHGLTVYFAGDTALAREDFLAARKHFPKIDLAILPIGPIAPRDFMRRTHVDPGEALDALDLLGAERMLAVHFDTFINSDDAPGECLRELRRQMHRRGIGEERVIVLGAGEQRVLVRRGSSNAWATPSPRASASTAERPFDL